MARMAGKVRREFDAEANVTLRDIDDGAETADASEAGVALSVLKDAYWDNNEQPNGIFLVSFHVSAADYASTDEVYDLYIEVDTASNFPSAKEVARLKSVPSTGYYEVPVSSQLIEALEAGATHIRVRLDVTGTTPSITYGAWMTYLKV
ncbi:MAG: hypothetical protein ACKO0Z_07200 [Betaproteobacteria bacterium]